MTTLVIAAGWAFAGTNAGVLRARIGETGLHRWELLPDSPLGVLSLAATHFAEDHSLLAGTPDGIFTSDDGGLSWKPARMPIAGSTVLALGFTGIEGGFLAGTLEDGVCITKNYGRTWESRNFGLLDQAVFALVFSPEFMQDGTAFLGAEGALYHTYNHARAWQELTFPLEALPVLSLALAPDFHENPTVFAGSETQGLWVSHDRGSSWSPLALPASTVNALAFWGNALLAATESGLYQSVDFGTSWTCLSDQANCLCLAVSPELALAGWAETGIMQSWSGKSWQPVPDFASRTFTGLVPAPSFPKDGQAYVYGPGEGLWQTIDSGASWHPLAANLPFSEINSLVGYAKNDREFCLLAATPEGVWLSSDVALSWRQFLEEACDAAWVSPSGQILLAALPQAGLRLSLDRGKTWSELPGNWQQAGRILACHVSDRQQIRLAVLENMQETVSFWQGQPGEMEEVERLSAPANPVVSLWAPPVAMPDRPWYASLGGQVWKFSSRRSGSKAHSSILSEADRNEPIIALTGTQTGDQVELFACTGRCLFHSTDDTRSWMPVYDFGNRRLVSLTLKQPGQEVGFYALFLGGELGLLNG